MQPTDDDMKRSAAALDRALNELVIGEGLELDLALGALQAQLACIIADRYGGPSAAKVFLDAARKLADMPSAARRDQAQMPVQGRA